jgi:hypothetical protein
MHTCIICPVQLEQTVCLIKQLSFVVLPHLAVGFVLYKLGTFFCSLHHCSIDFQQAGQFSLVSGMQGTLLHLQLRRPIYSLSHLHSCVVCTCAFGCMRTHTRKKRSPFRPTYAHDIYIYLYMVLLYTSSYVCLMPICHNASTRLLITYGNPECQNGHSPAAHRSLTSNARNPNKTKNENLQGHAYNNALLKNKQEHARTTMFETNAFRAYLHT